MLELILATWRLTSLLHREQGPGEMFEKLRHAAGVRYDEHSERYATTNLAAGFLCFWCCSVWGAGIVTLLAAWAGKLPWRAVVPRVLAASAGAIVVDGLVERWL